MKNDMRVANYSSYIDLGREGGRCCKQGTMTLQSYLHHSFTEIQIRAITYILRKTTVAVTVARA